MTERRARAMRIMYTEAATSAVSVLGALVSVLLHSYHQAAGFGVTAATSLFLYGAAVGKERGFRQGVDHGYDQGLEDAELDAATPMACQIWVDPTPGPPDHGFVYVIEFSSGVVKVGQTRDPLRRISEHWRDAGAFNVAIVGYWISEPHLNYLDNEVALIDRCHGLGTRAKQEYFIGADFETVVRFAAGLVPVGSA